MKKLFSIAILGVILAMLAACGSGGSDKASGNDNGKSGSGGDKLSKLKDKGSVTVGFSNEAPYAYKDEDGKLTGAAVEVAKAVFKDMGIDKVKGQLMDYGQLIPGIKSGKLDVITAGMAINEKRCKQIAFGHPSVVYGEGIAVKKGNPKDIHSYKDIKDKNAKVAVLNSGTEPDFLNEVGVKDNQMMKVPSVSEGFSAVKTGRADVTTATELTVKKAVKDSGSSKIEYIDDFTQPDIKGVPSYGAAGFNKDNDKLRKAYNKHLEKLRDSGKIKKVVTSLDLWDEGNLYKGKPTTKQICNGKS